LIGHLSLLRDLRPRHLWQFVAGLATTAIVLHWMGRVWWCAAGDLRLWSGDVRSRHNSQHFLDPYAVTHVLHGLAFYYVAWLGRGWSPRPLDRARLALAVEMLWEVLENTDTAIQRYRAATISFDYFGDSVGNSIGDVLSCAVGYLGASMIPPWASLIAFFAGEGILAVWIRDGLILNLLMLVHPIERVKEWQLGPIPWWP
jgi:hypothetical protein